MSKKDSRSPVIRKPTSAEQLAALNPFERGLLRIFEFMASIKLAITLMVWLMIECAVGTVFEARVNASAARYFVYQSWHFYLLLGLLALNILCAALIRFPWKRYQTGFVVTHLGLLTLLFGTLVSWKWYKDTLMIVPQGEVERNIFDPNREELRVTIKSPQGKEKRFTVPVNFGPFSWGERFLGGLLPWGVDHTETFELDGDTSVRVKRYYANSDYTPGYTTTEQGMPAVWFRLFHPERADMKEWLAVEPRLGMATKRLGPADIVLWEVSSDKVLDHVINGFPKESPKGDLGTLTYTHDGTHQYFDVDKLVNDGPITVPETGETLSADYLANATVGAGGKLVDKGDFAGNPALRITVKKGDEEREYLTFAFHPEFQGMLARRQGTERLFSYHREDTPIVVQLIVAPSGKLGYRAFGSQGLIASEIVELGKEYPSWAGQKFMALKALPSARQDLRLSPKPPSMQSVPGIVVDVTSDGKTEEIALVRRGNPRNLLVGDDQITIQYDNFKETLPFGIRLDDFEQPSDPGTRKAAMYTSMVTVVDEAQDKEEDAVITMNAPLHYKGISGPTYTFYQTSISRFGDEWISTYTVASDPGLIVKYIGAIVLCSGIFLMFYMGGYFKGGKKKPTQPTSAYTQEAEELSLA
ncbi:ResB-like family protein [Planctomycetes bacterium Pan216]|uniref:ResB-like family protein n=1 Tax=Kolteria novifilia TaxID=2527975 RepID=A0A518B982_9BACT|nr:ResB-like family protein [Planctomycetes bacterium Pan216]